MTNCQKPIQQFPQTTTNDNETTICAAQNILYFNNKKDLISRKSVINLLLPL